jgi:hypothetical protein
MKDNDKKQFFTASKICKNVPFLPQCVQSLRKVQIEIQKRVSKRKMANLYAGFKFIDADYYKKVTIKKLQEKNLGKFSCFSRFCTFYQGFYQELVAPCIQHPSSNLSILLELYISPCGFSTGLCVML